MSRKYPANGFHTVSAWEWLYWRAWCSCNVTKNLRCFSSTALERSFGKHVAFMAGPSTTLLFRYLNSYKKVTISIEASQRDHGLVYATKPSFFKPLTLFTGTMPSIHCTYSRKTFVIDISCMKREESREKLFIVRCPQAFIHSQCQSVEWPQNLEAFWSFYNACCDWEEKSYFCHFHVHVELFVEHLESLRMAN